MTQPLGLLIASFDIGDCPRDEFNDWYDTEHIPDRQKVPGFLNFERWVGAEDPNLVLAIYDLQSVNVLQSPEYLRIGFHSPSPWTRRLMPKTKIPNWRTPMTACYTRGISRNTSLSTG